jgi:hypothetical protein
MLDRIPRPEPAAEWLWQGYLVLAAKRFRFYKEPQPIQMTEIKAYADYLGIEDEFRRALLFHIVSVLDQVYLQDCRDRQPK